MCKRLLHVQKKHYLGVNLIQSTFFFLVQCVIVHSCEFVPANNRSF